jgi:hypothetical protein
MLAILLADRGGAAAVLRNAGLEDAVVESLRARVVES